MATASVVQAPRGESARLAAAPASREPQVELARESEGALQLAGA